MEVIQHDARERHVKLHWEGPFLLRDGKLVSHPLEPYPIPNGGGGLYMIHGLNPLSNNSCLLYIGLTERFGKRIADHGDWLGREWRVEVYLASVPDPDLRADLEALLIYSHQPQYNSRDHSRCRNFTAPLRIWNVGRFWGLHPEVSSRHPWNE